jgi:hypothetical protein
MTFVTLIHPKETFTILALQAITKCSLFQNNPTLTSSPYKIQSRVSLAVFQEFISALQSTTVKITNTNFTELQQLCQEFGFDELSAKLSQLFEPSEDSLGRQIGNPLTRMRNSLLSESFLFTANGTEIAIEVADSLIFPAVREQLSVDGCARKFVLNESGIEAADIRSLQLLLSGEAISIRRSMTLLIRLLGNVNLEQLFLNCSKADIRMNLSDLVKERRIELESVDVSVLSVAALDSLLLSESILVESEEALLRFILKLGPDYRYLLRHIKIEFLSEDGLFLLDENLGIPPESVLAVCCRTNRAFGFPVQFTDHFRLSGDLRRVRKEAIFTSMAWQQ